MKDLVNLPDFALERAKKLKSWGLDKESIENNKKLIMEVSSTTADAKGKELVSLIGSKKYTDSSSNVDKVINLIKEGANLSYESDKGNNPLLLCARKGYISTFIALLKFGANINIINKNKTTCIMSSARHGHNDILEIAIYMGGDINARDFGGDTALILAKKHGQVNSYNILIENGAYIDTKNVLNLMSYNYQNVDGSEEIDDRKYYASSDKSFFSHTTHEEAMDLLEEAKLRVMNMGIDLALPNIGDEEDEEENNIKVK